MLRIALLFAFGMFCVCISPAWAEELDTRSNVSSKYLLSEAEAVELVYSGQVIDKRTRKPISGAEVIVRRKKSNYFDFSVIEETSHRTDAEGVYQFSIPPEQSQQILLYIELDVRHPDYAPKIGFGYSLDMIRKNERLGDPPFFRRIELYPSSVITGRLIGPDGMPVSGADIQSFSRADPEQWKENFGAWCKTKSDEFGRFKLDVIKDAESVFWVVANHLSPIQVDAKYQRGDLGDIELDFGVSVSGQILNVDGHPVAGVWVNMHSEEPSTQVGGWHVASLLCRSALTDQKGEFQLSPSKPGNHRIGVDDRPHELKFANQNLPPIKLDDAFIPVSIELDPVQVNASITLQAIPTIAFQSQTYGSNGDRRPGYGVFVWGEIEGNPYSKQWIPSRDGHINGRLPRGLQNTRLLAQDNEHHAVYVRLADSTEKLVGNEHDLGTLTDNLKIEIVRLESPIALVKPVDEKGIIIRDCRVEGEYTDVPNEPAPASNPSWRQLTFEQQNDGRFRSRSMLPDREVAFTVKASGYADEKETCRLAEGAEQEILIKLQRIGQK